MVDDEEDVRTLLRTRFERDGRFVIVAEAAEAADAAELCGEHRPHAVILDAGVPDLSGIAIVPDIRRVAPETVVVVYTSDAGLATRNEAERVGAHAVVGKHDPFDLLVGAIHRFVSGSRPEDPEEHDRAEFGQKMTELLGTEDHGAPRLPWWKRPGRSRVGFIALLVLVVLPLLAAVAWLVAWLAGQLL